MSLSALGVGIKSASVVRQCELNVALVAMNATATNLAIALVRRDMDDTVTIGNGAIEVAYSRIGRTAPQQCGNVLWMNVEGLVVVRDSIIDIAVDHVHSGPS